VVIVPGSLPGVLTVSHLMIPGSAEAAYGIARPTGITNEASMTTVKKTAAILKKSFLIDAP
jgi:hypothetical protein